MLLDHYPSTRSPAKGPSEDGLVTMQRYTGQADLFRVAAKGIRVAHSLPAIPQPAGILLPTVVCHSIRNDFQAARDLLLSCRKLDWHLK